MSTAAYKTDKKAFQLARAEGLEYTTEYQSTLYRNDICPKNIL